MLRIRLIENHSNEENTLMKLFYVHYIDYNKRLDEWVSMDRMKLDKIQAPLNSQNSHHQTTTLISPANDDDDDKESVKSASIKGDESSNNLTVNNSSATNKRKRKSNKYV